MRIYLIENLMTHKVYIGQTVQSLSARFSEHKSRAKSRTRHYLHNSIRKYGVENFEISQICEASSVEELNKLETWFVEFFRSTDKDIGYNIRGGGGNIGKHSEETKRKISEAAGRGEEHHSYGVSPANKGKPMSAEQRAKLSLVHTGVKRGPMAAETKKKIADAQTGEKNHRYGKTGEVFTEERLRRMSEGMKRAWARKRASGQPWKKVDHVV